MQHPGVPPLGTSLTLLGIADNPLDPALMQLYLAGLPVLLAHLKATRSKAAANASAAARGASGDLSTFDLFSTALPTYPISATS